jgi:hypothetical protein
LSSAASGEAIGIIVHENRLAPNMVGVFDKSMVPAMIRIFVHDFLSSGESTSICSSFDAANKTMHIDVNSSVPLDKTVTDIMQFRVCGRMRDR